MGIDELVIVYIIGLCISVIILVFLFVIVMGMKRWTEQRDKYYTETHNNLKNEIRETRELIKGNVDEVLDSVKNIIKKVK